MLNFRQQKCSLNKILKTEKDKTMPYTIFIFTLLFFIPVKTVEANEKDYCANKWPTDYQMREYCEDQQNSANNKLFSLAESNGLVKNGRLSPSSNGNDHERIIYRCMKKWEQPSFETYDFTMVVYCIEQQFDAYNKTTDLEKSSSGTTQYCSNKWPNDYQMREYCEDQQNSANNKLFSLAESNGLVKNGRLSASPDGNVDEKIVYRCMNKWEQPSFETYDFTMVVYCIEQQIQAYR